MNSASRWRLELARDAAPRSAGGKQVQPFRASHRNYLLSPIGKDRTKPITAQAVPW